MLLKIALFNLKKMAPRETKFLDKSLQRSTVDDQDSQAYWNLSQNVCLNHLTTDRSDANNALCSESNFVAVKLLQKISN